MILTPLQKLPKNVGDLGKLIVAKGFKKLPKVQKIAKSGHTAYRLAGVSSYMAGWIFIHLCHRAALTKLHCAQRCLLSTEVTAYLQRYTQLE